MLLRSIINSKKTVRERHKKNLRTVQHISRLSRRSAPSVNRVEYAAVKSNFHAVKICNYEQTSHRRLNVLGRYNTPFIHSMIDLSTCSCQSIH